MTSGRSWCASSAPSIAFAVSPMMRRPGMRERRPASSGEMVACSSMVSTVKPGSFFMQPAYEVRTALLKGQKSRRKRANRPIARPRARGPYNLEGMVTSYTAEDIRGLVDAGIALTSELSLDGILLKLVDVARTQAGARYAAISVLGDNGEISQFVTSGISDEERAKIGHIPYGKGLLGVLLHEGASLRLADLAKGPSLGRVSAESPADEIAARRAGGLARADHRKPLSHRQAASRSVRRARRGDCAAAWNAGGRRYRDKPSARAARESGSPSRARTHRDGPARWSDPDGVRGRAAPGRRRGYSRPFAAGSGPRPGPIDREPAPGDQGHPELHLRPSRPGLRSERPAGRDPRAGGVATGQHTDGCSGLG